MKQQNTSVGHPSYAMQDETATTHSGAQALVQGSQYPSGSDPVKTAPASGSAAQSREVQHG